MGAPHTCLVFLARGRVQGASMGLQDGVFRSRTCSPKPWSQDIKSTDSVVFYSCLHFEIPCHRCVIFASQVLDVI